MTNEPDPRAVDFDGLVVESPRGDRLLALPIAVLEVLRYASVIQYRRAGRVHRMRVDGFMDGRTGGTPAITQARDEMTPRVDPPPPAGSAPTPEYGAPTLPITPSPAPPPPPGEEPGEDPADIPIRVKRGGQWVDAHVTRAQYERYVAEGRITQGPPAEGTQP